MIEDHRGDVLLVGSLPFETAEEVLLVPDLGSHLAEIAVPTLALVGTADVSDMAAISERLAAEIPNARLERIEGGAPAEPRAPGGGRPAADRVPRLARGVERPVVAAQGAAGVNEVALGDQLEPELATERV